MVAGATCLRVRNTEDASLPPVEVLELCDRLRQVAAGRVGVLSAVNLASSLVDTLQQFDEARAFLRDRIPEAVRALGKDHGTTLRLERMHAQCLYRNNGASRDDITTAIATLEQLYRRITRIYGATHPQTRGTQDYLEKARETLARAK